jgi:hypothetical protein
MAAAQSFAVKTFGDSASKSTPLSADKTAFTAIGVYNNRKYGLLKLFSLVSGSVFQPFWVRCTLGLLKDDDNFY